jgi:hypothetical protein
VRFRISAVLAVAAAALVVTSSAVAFDCIRVSSSLQGLQQSATKGGHWLLFDLSSAQGTQDTFANVFGADISSADAACFAQAYATTGQPQFWALGLGVAAGNKDSVNAQGARSPDQFGVLAWHNKNVRVLSNGTGVDHLDDSPILGAVFVAAEACNVQLPE